MDKETFIKSGLIEQYVMGLASPEEMKQVEQMAAAYPEVNQHIDEMQDCMKRYVEMHSIPPPKRSRQRIIDTIDEMEMDHHEPVSATQVSSNTAGKVVQLSRWMAGVAAALFIGLLGACLYLFSNQLETQENMAQLSKELQILKSDHNTLQQNNQLVTQQYVVLKDLATKHIRMQGTAHAPSAKVVVYWNNDHNKALLNVVNLPKAPHGHQYQVWADVNGKHKDMGVLNAGVNESNMHQLPYINNCRGFVITLEVEGGSPHPNTEKMYATGEMSL